MILQKVKPVTSSRRQLIKLNQQSLDLSKKPILKHKLRGIKNSSGRNHSGRITVFHMAIQIASARRTLNTIRTSDKNYTTG